MMLGYYLMFNRNCAEALETYSRIFSVPIEEKQCYGDMPSNPDFPVAEKDKELVLHSRLTIAGTEIMCADSAGRNQPGSNMYISLTMQDEAFIRKAWDALKPRGEIYMELTPTFFAAAHGSLRDRFGVNWIFTALK